jgi:hypothetical protein
VHTFDEGLFEHALSRLRRWRPAARNPASH